MPIYTYVCKACNYTFDNYETFQQHDKPKKRCPQCKKHQLNTDCSNVYVSIKHQPKTVYHQAIRNTEKMGKYELEAKREKGKKKKKKPREIPFWRDGDVKPELLTATRAETQKYIEKGVLPPNRIKESREIKQQQKKIKNKK